jgi:folate-binding protein YgfZ
MTKPGLLSDLVGTDPSAPFARSDAPFRLLRLEGPDAGDFLQRLCTQDVLGAGDGEVRPAAFLDAKGKLVATCLVVRIGGAFWLEVAAEQEEKLAALLERYHFTEKLTIVRVPAQPVHEHVWYAGSSGDNRAALFDGHVKLAVARRGVLFERCHGAMVGQSILRDDGALVPATPRRLDEARAECLRMLAGFVRVGIETEPATLALEALLDDHCSTTKGCYTGQEIVARIHTYGHVNRKACLLRLPPGPGIAAPQPLHEPEDRLAVGRVLHAVMLPDGAGRLGIGYLPKDFQALGTQLVLADGTAVQVVGYEPLPGALPA